jgi:hypothetical protein
VKGKVVTQLALTGARPACSARSAASRKKRRRLLGSAKGAFRTKGRYGAATVRGTRWQTEDLCNGTLVTVQQGVVAVESFVLRRTRLVRAGQSYLAPARR